MYFRVCALDNLGKSCPFGACNLSRFYRKRLVFEHCVREVVERRRLEAWVKDVRAKSSYSLCRFGFLFVLISIHCAKPCFRPFFNLLLTHGAVSVGVLRGQPASARIPPRSLRLSDRVSTSSPGAWETAGRRWPSSPAVEWMVPRPGRPQRRRRARVRKGPRSPSGPTPSPATPAGTPSSAPASSTPSAPFRGHERPRQDHGPGNSGLPQGRARRPRPPGGDSGQPCREWTKGSHSPGPRRAARRCSSRERGDWPGPAGRAFTGGRRQERGRRASAWTVTAAGIRFPGAQGRPRPAQIPDAAVG